MKKIHGLVFLCLVLACSSLLSACGGDGGGGTSPIATQETSPATTQETSPATTQETSPATTQTQQPTSTESSPFADIPIYPGFSHIDVDFEEITGSLSGSMGGVDYEWHYYEAERVDIGDVMDYYNDYMSDNGWTPVFQMETPEMEGSYAMYAKTTETVTILVFKELDYMDKYILAICKSSM